MATDNLTAPTTTPEAGTGALLYSEVMGFTPGWILIRHQWRQPCRRSGAWRKVSVITVVGHEHAEVGERAAVKVNDSWIVGICTGPGWHRCWATRPSLPRRPHQRSPNRPQPVPLPAYAARLSRRYLAEKKARLEAWARQYWDEMMVAEAA